MSPSVSMPGLSAPSAFFMACLLHLYLHLHLLYCVCLGSSTTPSISAFAISMLIRVFYSSSAICMPGFSTPSGFFVFCPLCLCLHLRLLCCICIGSSAILSVSASAVPVLRPHLP